MNITKEYAKEYAYRRGYLFARCNRPYPNRYHKGSRCWYAWNRGAHRGNFDRAMSELDKEIENR